VTTIRDHDAKPTPDLVERRFTAKAPNQLRVADINLHSDVEASCILPSFSTYSAGASSAGRWPNT
jgi:hypothetical protein